MKLFAIAVLSVLTLGPMHARAQAPDIRFLEEPPGSTSQRLPAQPIVQQSWLTDGPPAEAVWPETRFINTFDTPDDASLAFPNSSVEAPHEPGLQQQHSAGLKLRHGPEMLPTPPADLLTPSRLTLADLESLALSRNPTLTQASARVQAARGTWTQAGLKPNPMLGYMAEEVGNEDSAGLQGAFVSQEFVRGNKLGLSQNAAAQAIRQAQQNYSAQRYRILNDVRLSYYELLAAQSGVKLSRELQEVGERGLAQVRSLIAGQEVAPIEEVQARIEAQSARLLLVRAQNRHQAAWRRLAAIVGSPNMSLTAVDGSLSDNLPALNWDDALSTVLASSPELGAASARVSQARWAVERERAQPIPNVNVEGNVLYDDGTGDTVAGVRIGLPIPVHNRNQGNIRQAEANLLAARAEISRVELSLQQRLAAAFERYLNAREQVEVYSHRVQRGDQWVEEGIIPDSLRVLETIRRGQAAGQFTTLNVLTAQRTYFQARVAYLDLLRELQQSRVMIEGLLLAGSLDGSLSMPSAGMQIPLTTSMMQNGDNDGDDD